MKVVLYALVLVGMSAAIACASNDAARLPINPPAIQQAAVAAGPDVLAVIGFCSVALMIGFHLCERAVPHFALACATACALAAMYAIIADVWPLSIVVVWCGFLELRRWVTYQLHGNRRSVMIVRREESPNWAPDSRMRRLFGD